MKVRLGLRRPGKVRLKQRAKRGRMRWIWILLCLVTLSAPLWAQPTVVERQGWKVLTFDVPGMELRGAKDGRSFRATYAKVVGEGEVKITINIKNWMAIDTFETTFREERDLARASGESRLREFPVIPGATKVLAYSGSNPYYAEVIVLYTKDFRCQLSVTASDHQEAKAEVEPTYQQLVKTLSMRGLSPISPVRVESDSPSEED